MGIFGRVFSRKSSPETTASSPAIAIDPAVLAQIVLHGDNKAIRMAAVRQIKDQATLYELIKAPIYNDDIQISLVEQLTDQALITKIATGDSGYMIRCAAIERMIDEAKLENIANHDTNDRAKWIADKRLDDLRVEIAQNTSDQIQLAQIALRHRSSRHARLIAAAKVTDQAVLAELALDEGYFPSHEASGVLVSSCINGSTNKTDAFAFTARRKPQP